MSAPGSLMAVSGTFLVSALKSLSREATRYLLVSGHLWIIHVTSAVESRTSMTIANGGFDVDKPTGCGKETRMGMSSLDGAPPCQHPRRLRIVP